MLQSTIKKGKFINESLINIVYHEVGHAFMILDSQLLKLDKTGIVIDNDGENHYVRSSALMKKWFFNFVKNNDESKTYFFNFMLSRVRVSIAGKVAAQIMTAKPDYKSGYYDTNNILKWLNIYKTDTFQDIMSKRKFLQIATEKTVTTLIENYKIIHLIATMCLVKPKNNKIEIEFIYKNQALPENIKSKIERDSRMKDFLNREINYEDFLKYKSFTFEDFFKYEMFEGEESKQWLKLYPNLQAEAKANKNWEKKITRVFNDKYDKFWTELNEIFPNDEDIFNEFINLTKIIAIAENSKTLLKQMPVLEKTFDKQLVNDEELNNPKLNSRSNSQQSFLQ